MARIRKRGRPPKVREEAEGQVNDEAAAAAALEDQMRENVLAVPCDGRVLQGNKFVGQDTEERTEKLNSETENVGIQSDGRNEVSVEVTVGGNSAFVSAEKEREANGEGSVKRKRGWPKGRRRKSEYEQDPFKEEALESENHGVAFMKEASFGFSLENENVKAKEENGHGVKARPRRECAGKKLQNYMKEEEEVDDDLGEEGVLVSDNKAKRGRKRKSANGMNLFSENLQESFNNVSEDGHTGKAASRTQSSKGVSLVRTKEEEEEVVNGIKADGKEANDLDGNYKPSDYKLRHRVVAVPEEKIVNKRDAQVRLF